MIPKLKEPIPPPKPGSIVVYDVPSWLDRNYRLIMLLSMFAELALLAVLVVLEWKR